jgi:hypothetical protein
VRLSATELDQRDGVEGGIELRVGQVLDETADRSSLRIARVERWCRG